MTDNDFAILFLLVILFRLQSVTINATRLCCAPRARVADHTRAR